jgi:hypothetical protein
MTEGFHHHLNAFMPPQSSSTHLVDDDITNSVRDQSTDLGDAKVSCESASSTVSDRSVSFSPYIDIHPIVHRLDMSTNEILDTWTNRMERKQSRLAIENTIFLMKSGVGMHLAEEDHFCARGLEHLYHGVPLGYEQEVKKSLLIVLAMQRILKRAGTNSPEMIARAYRKYTLRSRCAALRKAANDRNCVSN